MIQHIKKTNDIDIIQLRKKWVNILITNKCNLSCGGCHQHCDLFNKKDHWFIPIEQLKYNIDILVHPCCGIERFRPIALFGGEPTLHPKWNQILDLISSYKDHTFWALTNAINKHKMKAVSNLEYKTDYKTKHNNRTFTASLFAAQDILKLKNKEEYWHRAKQCCHLWKDFCGTIIYDNRAYLCDAAASLDRLRLGSKNWDKSLGWEIKPGEDPFMRTDKEIESQACNFCYRCGYITNKVQSILEKTIISPTNYDLYKKCKFL